MYSTYNSDFLFFCEHWNGVIIILKNINDAQIEAKMQNMKSLSLSLSLYIYIYIYIECI